MVLSKHAGLSQFSNWINTRTPVKILNDNHYLLNFIAGNNKLLASNIHWFVWPSYLCETIHLWSLHCWDRASCGSPKTMWYPWCKSLHVAQKRVHHNPFQAPTQVVLRLLWLVHQLYPSWRVCLQLMWSTPRYFLSNLLKVQNNLFSEMILVTNATLQNFPVHLFSGINVYYTFLDIVQYYCCQQLETWHCFNTFFLFMGRLGIYLIFLF